MERPSGLDMEIRLWLLFCTHIHTNTICTVHSEGWQSKTKRRFGYTVSGEDTETSIDKLRIVGSRWDRTRGEKRGQCHFGNDLWMT